MNSQTGSTLEIPLKKLVAWNGNVRRTKTDQGIKELAASIAAYGLLQNLVVKKSPRGQYAVVAGERRLLALIQLAESGTYKWTAPIRCLLTDADAPHTEIGLAENIVCEDMHPVEQFQAFLKLINQGQSVADIAARFGVAEGVVERRLALARVNPLLLQKYREGEMNLELLQAFTLTDDHAAQEAVWHQLQPWNRKPHSVRQMLSHDDIPADDKRVRFVGLDVYEAEGGAVRRDLFADGEEGTYVSDPTILSRLVDVKLQSIADGLQEEGWKWVTIQPDLDHQAVGRFRRLQPTPILLSKAAAKKLTKLEGELEELQAQLAGDENGDEDTLYQQIDALEGPYDEAEYVSKRDEAQPEYNEEEAR